MSPDVKSYRFDIDAEVRDFYASCPEHRDAVLFVDMTNNANRAVCAAEDAEKVNALLQSDPMLQIWIRNYGTAAQPFAAHRPGFTCIAMHSDICLSNLPRLTGKGSTADVEALFAFDHEIGHFLSRDIFGLADGNLRECQADAFAVLRHFQRFGMDSKVPPKVALMRGIGLVFRKDAGIHFTTPMIEKIIRDVKSRDIMGLTIAETAQLAFRYADELNPGSKKTGQLSKAFNAVANRWPQVAEHDAEPVAALKKIAVENHHRTPGKWAKAALKLAGIR